VLLLAPDNSDADLRRRLRMRLAAMRPAESSARL
jgi:toxin CptA